MKYDEDMNGEFADIFIELEKIILSYLNIKVKKNAHQTSYRDEYKVVVMLRTANDGKSFVSSWGQGAKLAESYSIFEGDGKIVRQINFANIKQIDEKLLRELITESMMLNMEYHELKLLKKRIKK